MLLNSAFRKYQHFKITFTVRKAKRKTYKFHLELQHVWNGKQT